MITAIHGIMSGIQTSAYDADALAFMTAAGITDTTQKDAINTLVLDLKAASIWALLDVFYPFVGGTATTHKYNLMNPLDTDAAFRAIFNGGITHSSTGMLPNGTTGYVDTNYNPYTIYGPGGSNNQAMGWYCRTNSSGLKVIVGGYENAGNYNQLIPSTTFYMDWPDGNRSTVANANSQGNYICLNNSTDGKELWKNGTRIINTTWKLDRNPNVNIVLGQWGNSSRYSNHELACFWHAKIGTTVTGSHVAALNTAIVTFQTSLSRNV
jgi:hypothetical protein